MTRVKLARGALVLAAGAYLAAATPAAVQAAGVYFVKEGDTLSKISRVFGVEVADIRATNRLTDDTLSPGDRLRIPDAAPQPPRPAAAAAVAPERVQQAICRDETVYHTVARGDTLFAIARRYGTGVDELLQINGFRRQSRLSIGQQVLVRRSGPRYHTVTRGETLSRIAKRYGVRAEHLTRLNGLDGTALVAGQKLQIEPCDPYAAAGSAPPPLTPDGAADQSARELIATLGTAETVAPAAHGAAPPSLTGRVIQFARSMLGIPYRFGGSTLRGIDCSAYVQRVFGLLDVSLPRTAREQFGVGARIGRDELAVGDLVFFRTYASFPSHVGIYVGDNLFIHASSVVRKVTIDSIDLPYYRKRFLGARRLVAGDTPALAASTP